MSRFFKATFFLLLLACVQSYAGVFDHPLKKEDSAGLEQVLSSMRKNPVVRGAFKQVKSVKKINREFVSTGRFTIAGSDGIIWSMEKPFANQTAITKKKMVQRSASGSVSEMNVAENAVFNRISQTIQGIFSGDFQLIQSEFQVYYEPVKGDKSRWVVGLVPKESAIKKQIASVELQGGAWLQNVKIVDGDGNPVTYEFSKVEGGNALTPEESALLK
jgi:outer membrane lipoprotein-sorting protein